MRHGSGILAAFYLPTVLAVACCAGCSSDGSDKPGSEVQAVSRPAIRPEGGLVTALDVEALSPHKERQLIVRGDAAGAELLVLTHEARRSGSDDLIVEVRIWNPTETPAKVFAPVFQLYQLEITDGRGKMLDLYPIPPGSLPEPSEKDFVRLPPGAFTGMTYLLRSFYSKAGSSDVRIRASARTTGMMRILYSAWSGVPLRDAEI